MLPGETKNTQCAKDRRLKKEIVTSHYTFPLPLHERSTCTPGKLPVLGVLVSLWSIILRPSCPCATLNIYSVLTQMNLTHPVSCCQTVSLLSMLHCAQKHTHTSANMKMQKLPKQHKCKLYSINWHCYQISSNSHHKRHALILCSAQKWIIPPATQGKNVLVFVLNFESRLTPERKQINKSNLNMDLDCYTRLVHTKTFN